MMIDLTEEEIDTILSAIGHRQRVLKASGDYPEYKADDALCGKLLLYQLKKQREKANGKMSKV